MGTERIEDFEVTKEFGERVVGDFVEGKRVAYASAFWFRDGDCFVGVVDPSGECFVEEFTDLFELEYWLLG